MTSCCVRRDARGQWEAPLPLLALEAPVQGPGRQQEEAGGREGMHTDPGDDTGGGRVTGLG